MSIATGRDSQASNLLQNPPPSIQIAITSICCLEALSVLEQDKKYRQRFEQEINIQIGQAQRNIVSTTAKSIVSSLRQASYDNQILIGETKARLFDALNQLANKVALIDLNAGMLRDSLSQILIPDLTDNLILHCLMGHARSHPTDLKVFLSGNVNDFGTLAVREALQAVGVNEYFRQAQDFLGWWQSQQG